MISFADGLKHLYLFKLNEVNQQTSLGLNAWLQNGKDYYVAQDQLNNDFTVCTYDYFDLLGPYAYDINRLSCASLESLKDIERKNWQSKFIGWNITKFYYSAFFSAHCILKIVGKSLSNIDSKSINKVKSITTSYGYTNGNLNSGLYCITLNSSNNSCRFNKNTLYDNSHEGLWRYFLEFLSTSQSSIYSQLPLAEAQLVVSKIDELTNALKNWNSQHGNWLSKIRNLVNYSQSYGVWFPYKEYETEYDQIYSDLNLHLQNPLTIDLSLYLGKDLLFFVRTCQLVNAIMVDLLNDLENKHPTNKSFVRTGIGKFKNLYS